MTNPTNLPPLEAFGATYLRLAFLLDASAESQWQAGRREQSKDDTSERSKGVTSDPTWRIASDDRRLRLRDAVREAERARRRADLAMAHAENALASALAE